MINLSNRPSIKPLKRIISCFLIVFLFSSALFLQPNISYAANGGRIGGGSFQSPSIPSQRGYGGNYIERGFTGGYRGGGIGFPFFLPIFGFGGGGLFGFLVIMALTGIIVNSIKGVTKNSVERVSEQQSHSNNITMIQLQIGLLASAKKIQKNLRNIAISADTKTSTGLQKVLQETTIALLREPNLWVYANLEKGKVPIQSAELTFNRISINERSKLKAEITTNVSGELKTDTSSQISGEGDPINEFIAVTLLIASNQDYQLSQNVNNEQIKTALKLIGSIPSTALMALEIIWQPEGEGDSLSKEELITSYPNLKYL